MTCAVEIKGVAPIYRKFAIVYAVAHSVKGGALIDRKSIIVYHSYECAIIV